MRKLYLGMYPRAWARTEWEKNGVGVVGGKTKL